MNMTNVKGNLAGAVSQSFGTLLVLMALYALALPGCTTNQKTVAYKSLNIVATSVDAGMKAFADAVVAGKVPQPTQDKVKDIHGRYTKALQAAIIAARFDTAEVAPADLQALANELITLISEALK